MCMFTTNYYNVLAIYSEVTHYSIKFLMSLKLGHTSHQYTHQMGTQMLASVLAERGWTSGMLSPTVPSHRMNRCL